jgi:serine protease Do
MRIQIAIGTALLAATVSTPGAFAQPRARVAQVMTTGTPYLGIGVKDVDSEAAKRLNLKDVRGVEITNVDDNSPAAKAGIKDGDVVVEYNGQPIEGGAQLSRMVRETPIGRTARVGVWRNGSMQTLTATIEEKKGGSTIITGGNGPWAVMPDMRNLEELRNMKIPEINMPSFSMSYQSPMLGIMGEPLGAEEQFADFLGVKEGVLVKSVNHNSAAEKAGIKAGDVIVKVEDAKVSASGDITRALREARAKKTVTVTIVRQKKEMPITVNIETPTASGSRVRAMVGQPGVIRVISSDK